MVSYLIKDNALTKAETQSMSLMDDNVFFCLSTPQEFARMDVTDIHPYSLRESLDRESHSRLDVHTEYSFGILNLVDVKDGKVRLSPFCFYLSKTALVLVDGSSSEMLHRFAEELSGEELIERYEKITPQVILLHLFETIIAAIEDCAEGIESDLENLEDCVLSNAAKEYLRKIVDTRKLIMHFRHNVEPLSYVIQSLAGNDNGVLSDYEARAFHILLGKQNKLISNVTLLRDYATQVREAFEAERDIKNNDIMRLLTIVTSIFLPLTLIAGWYGMNFVNIPELQWTYGYPYVIALCTAIFVVLILFFRRKKWM